MQQIIVTADFHFTSNHRNSIHRANSSYRSAMSQPAAAPSTPHSIISPHASLLRPDVSGSRAILPGSPMPMMYEDNTTQRSGGAAVVPPGVAFSLNISHTQSPTADCIAMQLAAASPRGSFSSPPPMAVQKKFKIYYCPEMQYLAQQIVKLDERFVLGDIQWEHFPDGFPNLFISG
ncbi:MAG: hypothetical protein Q7T57_09015, partial [Dehalococcoidales bacterium]|nr:hypothetical protein [Dehalococcoidales bacterium]